MSKFAFLVNNDGYKKYTYESAKMAGASVPHIGRLEKLFEIHNAEPLNRYFELPLKSIWYRKIVDETKFNADDEIFFILYESFHMSYSRKIIKHYRKKYVNARFIYIYTNPVDDYNSGRLARIKDLLDAVISFNEEDARKYGYIFFEANPFLLPKQDSYEPKTDVFFVGADKGRLPQILDVFRRLRSEGFICDFWITGVPKDKQEYADVIHYNQRLSYEEVLQRDAQTRCILEILQDGKSYSSIRTLEAIQYRKKVLTMSKSVIDSWFYNPEIIQVFNCGSDIDTSFIRKPVDEKNYNGLDFGSFDVFEEFFVRTLSESKEDKVNSTGGIPEEILGN